MGSSKYFRMFRRHNKEWSHTVHTRAVGLGDVKLTRMGDMNKNKK